MAGRPDGCRLFFEFHGDPGIPPLVLLEGLGGEIPGWRRNLPHLAAELHVVAYDFRGNGGSDEPMTMATFVDDTIAEQHPEHVAEDFRIGSANPQKPRIGIPTLMLHGTEDWTVDPKNVCILAERIPGAELLLLEGAGHLYHSEQPEKADAAVLDFVRRHPA